MTLPPNVRRALDEGILCHLAVRANWGPHLTPVVFVLDGGRLWVTTSRSSIKAKAWRLDPRVAGMVRAGDAAVTFRGAVRTYDALNPVTWPGATASGPGLVRAAARFSVKNARFFAGYAVDAGRVPFAWTPPGRVFAGVRISGGIIVQTARGRIADTWGDWDPGGPALQPRYHSVYAPLPRRRALDLRVPGTVRVAVGTAGAGVLALGPAAGDLSVLPVTWMRTGSEGAYEAAVPRGLLDGLSVHPSVGAALTIDHASTWRAADMAGLLMQGEAQLFAPGVTTGGSGALLRRLNRLLPSAADPRGFALVRLRPKRLVWWEGWASGTVRA